MRCPRCGSIERQSVKETRLAPDGRINRRRQCPDCRYAYLTTEQLSPTALRVRKSDGSLVAFKREAVRRSVERATVGGVSHDELVALTDRIVERVYRLGEEGPISTADVGAAVLAELQDLDPASHVRFALVQEGRRDRGDDRAGWDDVVQFRRWLLQAYPDLAGHAVNGRLERVRKRSGRSEPYRRRKLTASVEAAAEGRDAAEGVERLAASVADDVERMIGDQPLVTSGQLSAEVMRSLRKRDHIAYLRYASLAKRFSDPHDYDAEARMLRERSEGVAAVESGSGDY